jgi:hypothetical protein
VGKPNEAWYGLLVFIIFVLVYFIIVGAGIVGGLVSNLLFGGRGCRDSPG